MRFVRPALRALTATALFGGGAAALMAWQSGFFATAVVCCVAGLWLAAGWPGPAREAEVTPPGAAPPAADPALRQLRVTLDQVPAPLLALDPGGGLHALNRAARALFGADDLVADPPDGTVAAITRAAAGERVILRLARSGGRAMAVSVATSFGPAGARLLAVLTDVQAEIHVAEAQALRELLAVLGHEIMNALTPVTSLAGSAQAALRDGTAEGLAQADEALGIVLRRARDLDRFVRGYRALARVPPPERRPVSATAMMREAASLFAARWCGLGVALELDVPVPDVVASLDAGLAGQALLNLLANAAEAALAGAGPPRVWLGAEAEFGATAFRIRDSGAGVPEGQAAAIFQPFTTTKPDGSGIGLSLARQIAQSHGGTLDLEAGDLDASRPGEGACFVLRL